MEIQRTDENHFGELAPTLVLAVRPALLPVQGDVVVGHLVADHGQRPVDRLPALQPRNRHATLLQKGMDAK